ncbi:unnamed protein product [Blepharisma stoltei]|uniref:TNFR-Cys domain-containing protein n=1 Tax=Blepharisma stoltei TaxID=1481888 RepID=A0AAU9K9K9_9CILI|nr:unnamed protein product [Blepharisma stoltei]
MNKALIFISQIVLVYSVCPNNSITVLGATACLSSKYYVDNKVCANACPSLFSYYQLYCPFACSKMCGKPTDAGAILFTLEFSNIKDLSATYIASTSNSADKWNNPGSISYNSPTQNSPLPTYDRGFYFATTSGITSNQSYTPAVYFILTLWIKPLASGEILNVISSSTQYLRIWADSSGVYKFTAKIYDSSGNANTVTGSGSSYSSSWHSASMLLEQTSCNSASIIFYIDGSSVGTTPLSSAEVSFPTGTYTWTIGNTSGGNSFRGFIYWLQARADTNTNYVDMPNKINCIDNQFWDGAACQNCDTSCPTWPWCIRSTDCRICYTSDCSACYGYSLSMCTACFTGIVPGCCDILGTTCTQTWTNTACNTGVPNNAGVCLYGYPVGWWNCGGNSCFGTTTGDFTGTFAGIYTSVYITGTSSSSYNYWNSPEGSDPLPAKKRGLYFNSNQYLTVTQNLSNTWSIGMWIFATSGTIISHTTNKLTISSSGTINFDLQKWDGTYASYSTSQTITLNAWSYVSYSVGFASKTTTLTPYYNTVAGTAVTALNYVFRLASGETLYIGKGSPNFNGFISYFQLWGTTTTDFSTPYNLFGFSGGIVATLWSCDYSHYYDGSMCQPCIGTCTMGCTRGTSCYICDDFLCKQCSSFLSGACTLCIDNASGTPCSCNSGFYQPINQALCSACYTGCASCTGSAYYLCASCGSSYFLYGSIQCLSNCPTGYTENTGTKSCDFLSNTGLSIVFYDKIMLNSIAGVQVGSSNSNTYPSYDSNDPYPSYLRGYYFSGSYYLSTNTVIGPYFTVSIWVYPTGAGTIVSKTISGIEIFCLEILNGSGYPKLSITLSDSSSFSVTLSHSALNSWNFIAFTGKIDTSYITTINSYFNSLATDSGSSSNAAYFQDRSSGTLYTGTKSTLSSGFTGFLYDLNIYNVENLQYSDYTTSSCTSPCTSCPSDHNCPNSCPLLQYYDGSSCANCMGSCTKGCRYTDTCGLCKTKQCYECTSFSGSCSSCITNAESDGSDGCQCKTNAFWHSSTATCDFCDAICSVCKQTTYFECTTCDTGKQLVDSTCLNDCPYGYGTSCSSVSTPVIDQLFDTDFQGSYGIFTTGADSSSYQFFNTPETVDPVPAYARGLYFDGNMYLLSSVSVYLSHSFSIGAWIYVATNGDLLQKQTRLTVSSTGAITALMEDTAQATSTRTLSPSSSFTGWAYVSFTLYYTSNASPIILYINGVSAGSTTISGRIYRDQASTNLQLGKSSSSGFVGFIYYFQLWNTRITGFSAIINGFTFCGSGLGASCLSTCGISTYKNGASCSACNSCSTGCIRANTCNICDDLLCSICAGFGSGKCNNCVSNASKNPINCVCDSGFRTSNDGFSCVACPANCQTCTGGGYYQCTACLTGHYFLNIQCLPECPSGYTQNSGTKNCDLSIATYSLDLSNSILLGTISGITVGASNANSYSNYDPNDPYPSYLRGYYFNSDSYIKTNFMLAPSFSISIWIKATTSGQIISKFVSATQWLIYILASGQPNISLLLSDSSTIISVTGSSSVLNNWFFVSFDCIINADGTTTVSSYIDGTNQVSSTTATPLYLLDSQSGIMQIGDSSLAFTGFLWTLKICTQSGHALDDYQTVGCSGSCTKCPADLSCPDNCSLSQYYNGSGCTNCIASCSKGCRNADTCRLCKTKECATCTEFSGTNSCLTCIANAVADGTGGCTCGTNAFWVASSQTCEICDALCSTCIKTTYFECSLCSGSSQLVGNVCLNGCPYGFGSPCSPVSTPVIDQSFNIDFQGSYGIFATGTSTSSFQFFNTPESIDPIPAYKRGLYFDGSMYLLSSANFLFSHSFSIGAWLYVITDGDWLEKESQQLVLHSTGDISAKMEDPTQTVSTKSLSSGSTLTNWNYLSVTFEYTSSVTNLNIYLNGVSVANTLILNYVFRDLATTNLMIGKSSSSGFVGVINAFQLWNSPINDFSSYISAICGSGYACLWSCDLSHYYDGTTYTACNSCSKGCVRSSICNICDDLLCSICSGFGSGKCTQCVSNASGTPCVCNPGYTTSADGLSCDQCSSGCSQCTGLTYVKCTACFSGYYFFAPTGQCLVECPSGYSTNSAGKACDWSSDLGIGLDLTDQVRLDTVSGFNVGSVNTNIYPDWNLDAKDPIPSYKRGYYFYQSNYLYSTVVIAPSFTISLWAKPLSAGVLLTKYTLSDILKISIVSSGYPLLSVTFSDSSSLTLTTPTNIISSWNFLSFTGQVQNDGKTKLSLYINTAAFAVTTTSSLIYFKDTNTGILYIGNDETSGTLGLYGFLARVNIYSSYSHQSDDYSTSCGGGCSVCPANNQCLSNCAVNEYPDSCTVCLAGCSQGCVSNLSCRLCRDKECYSCTTFSGECTSCITNAYKPVDHCMCLTNAIWISSTQSCELCNAVCATCSTLKIDGCLTCIAGHYLIQSLCISFCPTGYVINGNNCDADPTYTAFLVFNLMPHQIKDIVLDLASSIPVLTGKDNKFYPTYDATDPIAAIYRGYYFSGSAYMQLPPYTGTASSLLTLAPKFIISTWIKPISGTGVIFSKQINSGAFTKYVSLELVNKFPSLTLTLQESTTITYTSALASLETTLSQWNFISALSDISTTPQQIVKLTANLNTDTSSDLHASWLNDLESSFFNLIGASYLDSTTLTSFFNGFLWDLKIYNTITASPLASSSCSGCSLCPIDNSNTCLDNCLIDKYWNGIICDSCLSGCSTVGCVRKDNTCNLCQDIICKICDNYTNTCITCKTYANLVGTTCKCDDGYYWNSGTENCEACDSSCKTCTSWNYLDCLTCADGYYMASGICGSSCPSGYSSTPSGCVLVQEKIFDLDLNTLNGVIYDKASLIPVVTGSTKQFYPDYEADDPIPAYLRGFWFNGQSSVLRLPEYSNYTLPRLVIAPTFTISIWLNIESPYSAILSKHNISNDYSTLYYISIMDSKPIISSSLGLSPIFHICEASLKIYEWSHLAFTLETASGGYNTLSCSINGISYSPSLTGYGVFSDAGPHTTMTIGAQVSASSIYNFYQGFMYSIQMFNIAKSVSSLSTTSCTEACSACPISQICIPNCKINQYWSGPAYNICYQCNTKCKKNCRDWKPTCSLCSNSLCDVCTDYSASGCTTCKEKAINPDSCICDVNYVLDTSTNNTCIPLEAGGFRGPDGILYSCPSYCISCESLTNCTACVENARLKNNLCYCDLGYNGTKNCTLVNFSVKVSVLSDNSLYLTFSDNLAESLTLNDFTITIAKQGKISCKLEQLNNTCYYISLIISEEISKGTIATLEFLNLTEMRSASNGVLNSSEISISLNSYDPAPYSPAIAAVTSQATASAQTAISGAVALSVVNPNPSSLWSMMNSLQILSYLTLSGIPFSSKMSSFLNNLNSFNLFPNVFKYVIDKNEGNTPYSQAKNFGFDTDLILITTGNDFTLILTSLSVFPIFFFFSRCSFRWVGKKFVKTVKAYQFAFYLRFWIQCYLELGAAASVGLITLGFSNITQITNFIICSAVYVLLVVTPPAYFWFSYKNKNRIQSREKTFTDLFSSFFYEFRTDRGLLATQYYFVFFIRRFIYIINLVFLRDYPQTEVTINVVLSMMTILHLIFFWPFEDSILQVCNLLTEISIFLIMSSSSVYLFNLDQDIVSTIENGIVAIVIAIMGIQSFASVAIFARTLFGIIHHKLTKAGIVKRSVHPYKTQVSKVEK